MSSRLLADSRELDMWRVPNGLKVGTSVLRESVSGASTNHFLCFHLTDCNQQWYGRLVRAGGCCGIGIHTHIGDCS